jgi:6-phosphogluconolactonase (cycloisomerase 2 family)
VPFSFVPDGAGRLALVSAGAGSITTLSVQPDGSLSTVGGPVSDGQAAACWIVAARGFDYVANAGSGTISQFRVIASGAVVLVNPTAASGVSGAIDMATTANGHFLYAESGASGSVDAFSVAANGILAPVQALIVTGGANLEAIATT